MDKSDFLLIVKTVVNFLHAEDYIELLKRDYSPNLTPQELETAIRNYGGEITLPPDEGYDKIHIYQVQDKDEYKIDFDLWIDNIESDLTLSLGVIEINGIPRYTIEDMHVL